MTASPNSSAESCTARPARILIVDDDDTFRNMLAALLKRQSYDVASARNGKEAVQLHRQSAAHLIVMDMMMPEQDGLETMLELRRLRSTVPIIAISGGGLMSYKDVLKAAKIFGAAMTMSKPFSMSDLLNNIKSILAPA